VRFFRGIIYRMLLLTNKGKKYIGSACNCKEMPIYVEAKAFGVTDDCVVEWIIKDAIARIVKNIGSARFSKPLNASDFSIKGASGFSVQYHSRRVDEDGDTIDHRDFWVALESHENRIAAFSICTDHWRAHCASELYDFVAGNIIMLYYQGTREIAAKREGR
jgi:hypothetical protein